ncbi:cytochrome c oxidase subunit VB [Pseudovirgaria hyperparasitica]|uniref:Cytochrome c oxidase subunit 4, mitochondrial n=1 Tax=Pseudovirgaria hyperparasitica TaxID=470096 RepID=A0A6A6W125_9PEZI|nr:cytochrome c oxidase subunit VB [Pseudovirgaria hyperparasitica]KAF2755277.1 cytochrome c oxidase subunit VB [Pseudovirgaria hyperparasitica]
MFLQRSTVALARSAIVRAPVKRTFAVSIARKVSMDIKPPTLPEGTKKLEEIRTMEDLLPPGAAPGTVPTDAEQATGLERLELIGKMQGVDIFDMKPLDASRLGTMENPIMVRSAGEEQYAGCTGFPAGSHNVLWQLMTRKRPIARCPECGSVYKMAYVGPPDDPHDNEHGHDDHHGYEEPKTFSDYVKPEYYYK